MVIVLWSTVCVEIGGWARGVEGQPRIAFEFVSQFVLFQNMTVIRNARWCCYRFNKIRHNLEGKVSEIQPIFCVNTSRSISFSHPV